MYVNIDDYTYEKDGVLGNGTADNSDMDETKLNYYGAPGAKSGEYSDEAVGKSVVLSAAPSPAASQAIKTLTKSVPACCWLSPPTPM